MSAMVETKEKQFTNVMLVMDIVDQLRLSDSRHELALNDVREEQALAQRVRTSYASQDIAVTDEQVKEAVAIWRTRRYAFAPLEAGWRRTLAEWYVTRGVWGATARRWAIVSTVVLATLGVGAVTVDAVQDARWESRVALLQKGDTRLLMTLADEQRQYEQATVWGLGSGNAVDQQLWDSWGKSIELAQANLVTTDWPDLLDERDSPAVEAVRTRQESGLAAVAAIEGWRRQGERRQSDKASLTALSEQVDMAQKTWNVPVRSGIAVLLADVRAYLVAEDLAQAQATWVRAQGLHDALAQQEIWRTRLDTWTNPAAREQGEAQWRALQAGMESGRTEQVTAALAALNELHVRLAQAYSLRIVLSPSERSGVERQSMDHAGRKNHYIIVDAVDATGAEVKIPVRNEETNRTSSVSRFGVRVPAAVFEGVKQDKMDNGLIDRNMFGEKKAGELDVLYAQPVDGGFITQW